MPNLDFFIVFSSPYWTSKRITTENIPCCIVMYMPLYSFETISSALKNRQKCTPDKVMYDLPWKDAYRSQTGHYWSLCANINGKLYNAVYSSPSPQISSNLSFTCIFKNIKTRIVNLLRIKKLQIKGTAWAIDEEKNMTIRKKVGGTLKKRQASKPFCKWEKKMGEENDIKMKVMLWEH